MLYSREREGEREKERGRQTNSRARYVIESAVESKSLGGGVPVKWRRTTKQQRMVLYA